MISITIDIILIFILSWTIFWGGIFMASIIYKEKYKIIFFILFLIGFILTIFRMYTI